MDMRAARPETARRDKHFSLRDIVVAMAAIAALVLCNVGVVQALDVALDALRP